MKNKKFKKEEDAEEKQKKKINFFCKLSLFYIPLLSFLFLEFLSSLFAVRTYNYFDAYYLIENPFEKTPIFGKTFTGLNEDNCFLIIDGEEYPFRKNIFFGGTGIQKIQVVMKRGEKIKTMVAMFDDTPIYFFNGSSFITSEVTDMSFAFSCSKEYKSKLFSLNITNFDTSKVRKMVAMFQGSSQLKYIIGLNTITAPNVDDIGWMFKGCSSLISIDLRNFKSSKLKIMQSTFNQCSSLKYIDLSNFDTKNVFTMNNLFAGCKSLEKINLSSFDTRNVEEMKNMFSQCEKLKEIDISNFNTEKVIDLKGFFQGCTLLEKINFGRINTSNVISMNHMFFMCINLKSIDFSYFDTSKVTTMQQMFAGCIGLTSLDISSFDTSNVNDFSFMFYGCINLKVVKISSNFIMKENSKQINMGIFGKINFVQ